MLALAITLVILDLITTLYFTKRWGPDLEENPVWRWLIRNHGHTVFALVFSTVWALLLWAAHARSVLLVAVCFGLYIVVNNVLVIRKLHQRDRDKSEH